MFCDNGWWIPEGFIEGFSKLGLGGGGEIEETKVESTEPCAIFRLASYPIPLHTTPIILTSFLFHDCSNSFPAQGLCTGCSSACSVLPQIATWLHPRLPSSPCSTHSFSRRPNYPATLSGPYCVLTMHLTSHSGSPALIFLFSQNTYHFLTSYMVPYLLYVLCVFSC